MCLNSKEKEYCRRVRKLKNAAGIILLAWYISQVSIDFSNVFFFTWLKSVWKPFLFVSIWTTMYMGDDDDCFTYACSLVELIQLFIFPSLTDYTSEEGHRMDQPKCCGHNIKSTKEEFNCPSKVWNVLGISQHYRQYIPKVYTSFQLLSLLNTDHFKKCLSPLLAIWIFTWTLLCPEGWHFWKSLFDYQALPIG